MDTAATVTPKTPLVEAAVVTTVDPAAEYVLRHQRWQMWLAIAAIVAIVVAVSVAFVAAIKAQKIYNDLHASSESLAASISTLTAASQTASAALAAVASVSGQLEACSASGANLLDPLPRTWLILGDPFSIGYPVGAATNSTWFWKLYHLLDGDRAGVRIRAAAHTTDDETSTFPDLVDMAVQSELVQAALDANEPLLVFLSYGYERLLTRALSVDAYYAEMAEAIAAHPELFANEQTTVVVLKRPLPVNTRERESSYVPQERMDCTDVPGGSVFNLPSSVDQSHTLALASSSAAASVPREALLSQPARVVLARSDQLLERYDLLSEGPTGFVQCLYVNANAQAQLAAYLAACLSGQTYAPADSL